MGNWSAHLVWGTTVGGPSFVFYLALLHTVKGRSQNFSISFKNSTLSPVSLPACGTSKSVVSYLSALINCILCKILIFESLDLVSQNDGNNFTF